MSVGGIVRAVKYIVREGLRGGRAYYGLLLGLLVMAVYGVYVWVGIQHAPIFLASERGGLVLTGMSDSVPWGLYISFFVFWVGVAAAGIMFALGAYVFGHPGFRKIAVLGEVQAIAALVIVLLLIIADMGRPLRALVLMPLLPNFPRSMLAWDFLVLTGYLVINLAGYIYTVGRYSEDRGLSARFLVPFVIIAAPIAIGIHTVTAFISQALTARPYWNTALLAPRYVATAFASGPALLLLVLLAAERTVRGFRVDWDVYRKTIFVTTGALIVGLYFTLSEVQELLWYTTEPFKKAQLEVLLLGRATPWLSLLFWLWVSLGIAAVILALIPSVRSTRGGVAFIALLTVIAVIGEKTLTIVLPSYIPDSLGQIRPYTPTPVEIVVTIGIHAIGFLIYAILAKPAIRAIMTHYKGEAH